MTPAIVALLSLILGFEVVRTVQNGLAIADQRKAIASQPVPPTAADVVEAARALPGGPAANPLDDLVKHRYIATLRAGEGHFAGVLTDSKVVATPAGPIVVHTFEQCSLMPTHDGDTPGEIAGRLIIESSGIAYLQQVV